MEGEGKDHRYLQNTHKLFPCQILNKDHLPARVLALTARLGGGEVEGSTPAAICHTHNLLACYSKYRSLTSTSLSFASRSRRRRSGRIHTCRLHSCTHEILLSILLTSTSLTCSSAHTYFCSWWRGRGRIIDTCRIHTQTVSMPNSKYRSLTSTSLSSDSMSRWRGSGRIHTCSNMPYTQITCMLF